MNQIAIDHLRGLIVQCNCNITQTLALSHCWVEQDHVGPFESHHIVPRAFGGENGPQVTLCTSCHTKAHLLGTKLYRLKGNIDKPKLMYLGAVIALAKHLVDDSAKTVKYSGAFTAYEISLLRDIQHDLNIPNQHSVLIHCLEVVHQKLRGNKI